MGAVDGMTETKKAPAKKTAKKKTTAKKEAEEEREQDTSEEIGIQQSRPDGGVETIVILRKEKTAGRPRLVLTEEGAKHIEKMASWGYTQEEVAVAIGVTVPTLVTPWNKALFMDAMTKGKSKQRSDLKRVLHRTAMQGNTQALIFLAKNILGMSDNPKPEPAAISPINDYAAELLKALQEDE